MIKMFIICFWITVFAECQAQTINKQSTIEEYEAINVLPHFSVSLSPYLTRKAGITRVFGNYTPTSTNMIGGEAGINYHLHISRDYFLIPGFRIGVAGRNNHIFIAKESFVPHLEHDVDQSGRFNRTSDYYFSLPFMVERRWQVKQNNHWNVRAGVNLRFVAESFYSYGSYQSDVNGQMVNVEHFDLLVGNKGKPWFNYNIGGGYALLLKRKNYLKVNVLANYSATDMVYGSYTINVTGSEPTKGRYTADLSFIGLSFTYVFTRVSHRQKAGGRKKPAASTIPGNKPFLHVSSNAGAHPKRCMLYF